MSGPDRDRVYNQLDRIEAKLDGHLDRISRLEESVRWLTAHTRVVTGVVVTLLTTALVAWYRVSK